MSTLFSKLIAALALSTSAAIAPTTRVEQSVELPIKLLRPGACYSANTLFSKCALNPAECDLIGGGATYRTSRYLLANDPARYEVCSRQENVRGIQAMGRCRVSQEKYNIYSVTTWN